MSHDCVCIDWYMLTCSVVGFDVDNDDDNDDDDDDDDALCWSAASEISSMLLADDDDDDDNDASTYTCEDDEFCKILSPRLSSSTTPILLSASPINLKMNFLKKATTSDLCFRIARG